MKASLPIKVFVAALCCALMEGCVYLAVERDGEFFPSTRDIWDSK